MSPPLRDGLLVLLFILLGGTFSGAEIALISLRDSQVKQLSRRGRRGQRLAKLVSDPNRFLAAVQVGVTLAGFFSAAFGAATLAGPVARWLTRRGLSAGVADTIAFIGVTIVVSYTSLVLGELAPKRLALQRAERVALFAAAPLDRIATIFRPLIWLLSRTTDVVVRIAGGDPRASRQEISEEELRSLVIAHESLTRDERTLIDEVFAASARQVREVMVPRTEVDFLEASTTVSRAAKIAMERPHSRYPVVGRNSDDVIGFVHIRDLLAPDRPGGRAATVGDLAREVKRLPGTKNVLAALSEMRRERYHLAIVVDEYGGTDGIVALEDLIEEVIGDIRDEYDVGPVDGPARPGGPVEVDGLLNLDDYAEQTGLRLPEGPYETAAGYVMAALGALPKIADVVEIDGWTLTVTELDGRRASRVRVTPPAAADPGAPDGDRSGQPAEPSAPAAPPALAAPADTASGGREPLPVPAGSGGADRGERDPASGPGGRAASAAAIRAGGRPLGPASGSGSGVGRDGAAAAAPGDAPAPGRPTASRR